MDWEEVGAIGQVLGSIAVFITLGYLAVQVRHSISQGQRALSQGRGEALRNLLAQQGEARISSILTKTLTTTDTPSAFIAPIMEKFGLTAEEAFRIGWLQFSWWSYRLQIIPYVDELPPMERLAFDDGIRRFYGVPGVARVFYETQIKPFEHPDAVRYIDNLLAQPG